MTATRRLAAILAAGIAGCLRLMGVVSWRFAASNLA